MSRIEDDRDAAREAERIALQRKEQDLKVKRDRDGDAAFSRLVQKSGQQQAQQQQQATAKSAIARLLEEEGREERSDTTQEGDRAAARDADAQARARAGQSGAQAKLAQARDGAAEKLEASQRGDDAEAAAAGEGRANDAESGEASARGRFGDAQVTRRNLDERKEADDAKKGAQACGRAEKGDLKTDADRKGGQGQGGGAKDDKGGQAAAFRLNPALMAPAPVARPKETMGSDRLRRLASEVAQKIVERVRVGTNAAGHAEFQIDLRSNVLSGLSIKISGTKGGRIKAVFSGHDKETLKMLREQQESLKSALTARGLSLEELRIEERA